MKHLVASIFASILLAGSLQAQSALTAFQARDLASKEVNNEARGKIVQIIGKMSNNQVMPQNWDVIFFDPYAKQDGRLVRVEGRAVTTILEGYTQMDRFRMAAYKLEEVIDPARLKIDSPQILDILRRSTVLKDITISNLDLFLHKPGKGNVAPVWQAKIFAVNKRSGKAVEIGQARISAETGQILHLKIDTNKLK
jgi:hypothetical protein